MKKFVIIGALVVVALGAALAFFVFGDDEPDPVSLDSAVESLGDQDEDQDDPDGETEDGDAAADTGISGTWEVDTESGEFDFEEATGSFVGFRVDEELTIGSTTAVGRTGDVTGSIEIDGTSLVGASFEVEMSTITTNDSRRDNRVRGALDTDGFPTATFTLDGDLDLGADAASGGPVSVTAPGTLTIKGVTNDVEIPIEAQLVDDTVVVVGSLDVVFADYDVEAPSAPIVVSVEDHGILEFQLLLTRAG